MVLAARGAAAAEAGRRRPVATSLRMVALAQELLSEVVPDRLHIIKGRWQSQLNSRFIDVSKEQLVSAGWDVKYAGGKPMLG